MENNFNEVQKFNNESNSQDDFSLEFQIDFNDNITKSIEEQYSMMGRTLGELKRMADGMKKMHSNMQKISAKTEITYEKVAALDKKLDDRVLLSDAEISEIYDVISELSIKIASKMDWKRRYPKAENFGQVCGWIRRTLWSIINRKFGVSSYKKIKFIQYNEALDFAHSLTTHHYYNRKGY